MPTVLHGWRLLALASASGFSLMSKPSLPDRACPGRTYAICLLRQSYRHT